MAVSDGVQIRTEDALDDGEAGIKSILESETLKQVRHRLEILWMVDRFE